MCGENKPAAHDRRARDGTSPHVWGKPSVDSEDSDRLRNIPTCVGKTNASQAKDYATTEHPHMCGENQKS